MAIAGISVERPRSSRREVARGEQNSEVVESVPSQHHCPKRELEVFSSDIKNKASEVVRLGQQLGVSFGNLEEVFLQQIIELESRDGGGQSKGDMTVRACRKRGGTSKA